MKPWKRRVLTTHTVCRHCWLIRYEIDMGPELSTAAADQNFAWICKQHQDLIGSVLIFRTKIIWSGPEFGLVRCGYLNAAIVHSLCSFSSWYAFSVYSWKYCFWCSFVEIKFDLTLKKNHISFIYLISCSVRVAERLALPTSVHGVAG